MNTSNGTEKRDGDSAGSAAHDLNNLLTAILGCAALAKLTLPADHPGRQPLDQIEQTARAAGELIRARLTAVSSDAQPEPISPPASPPPKSDGLILLAQAHAQVGALLAATLHSCGYEAMLATNGLRFVQLYEQHGARAKTLVLDVDLPDGSGLERLRQIRAKGGRTPALLITSDGETDFESVLDADAVWLSKPFQMREFSELVREMADGRPRTDADASREALWSKP